MSESGGLWLVMHRDVSDLVSVEDASAVHVVAVLDPADGMVLAISVAGGAEAALHGALARAASQPMGGRRPARPAGLLAEAGLAALVRAWPDVPAAVPVEEVEPGDEAQDVVDLVVGHLAGRRQPTDQPSSEEWASLYAQALRFAERRPWERWNPDAVLQLDLEVGEMAAAVLGADGIQRGLALSPAAAGPAASPEAAMPGTIILWLDAEGVPSDLAARARRYGWPDDAELLPVFGAWDAGGAQTIDAAAARSLTEALGAVLDRDAAGEPAGRRLFRGEITFDPALQGARLGLGGIGWPTLADVRSRARVHRQAPIPLAEVGDMLPILSIDVNEREGEGLVSRFDEARPVGVAVVEDAAKAYVVLLCEAAAFGLIETTPADPHLRRFRDAMATSEGAHCVLVASVTQDAPGVALGLFECRLPQPA